MIQRQINIMRFKRDFAKITTVVIETLSLNYKKCLKYAHILSMGS